MTPQFCTEEQKNEQIRQWREQQPIDAQTISSRRRSKTAQTTSAAPKAKRQAMNQSPGLK